MAICRSADGYLSYNQRLFPYIHFQSFLLFGRLFLVGGLLGDLLAGFLVLFGYWFFLRFFVIVIP